MMTLLGCAFSHEVWRCKASENLIVNGDFEKNDCPKTSTNCIWNSLNKTATSVPSWIGNEIEVGRGSTYNTVFGHSWVV